MNPLDLLQTLNLRPPVWHELTEGEHQARLARWLQAERPRRPMVLGDMAGPGDELDLAALLERSGVPVVGSPRLMEVVVGWDHRISQLRTALISTTPLQGLQIRAGDDLLRLKILAGQQVEPLPEAEIFARCELGEAEQRQLLQEEWTKAHRWAYRQQLERTVIDGLARQVQVPQDAVDRAMGVVWAERDLPALEGLELAPEHVNFVLERTLADPHRFADVTLEVQRETLLDGLSARLGVGRGAVGSLLVARLPAFREALRA